MAHWNRCDGYEVVDIVLFEAGNFLVHGFAPFLRLRLVNCCFLERIWDDSFLIPIGNTLLYWESRLQARSRQNKQSHASGNRPGSPCVKTVRAASPHSVVCR